MAKINLPNFAVLDSQQHIAYADFWEQGFPKGVLTVTNAQPELKVYEEDEIQIVLCGHPALGTLSFKGEGARDVLRQLEAAEEQEGRTIVRVHSKPR
jgi:hypothetical protein